MKRSEAGTSIETRQAAVFRTAASQQVFARFDRIAPASTPHDIEYRDSIVGAEQYLRSALDPRAPVDHHHRPLGGRVRHPADARFVAVPDDKQFELAWARVNLLARCDSDV